MDAYFDTLSPDVKDAYFALHTFFVKNFENPAKLLAFYDKQLRTGEYSFYPWQAKIHKEHLGDTSYTGENPLELVITAVNGSGKDKMVISPFVPWFLMTNLMGTITCTSSSSAQLNNQTEKYIRLLCTSINTYHQVVIFDIKQRNIKCLVTGSEIFLYATDDAGKAEGYHPVEYGRKFAIIVNEAKSVASDIFEALTRCSGYTHWIEVSSPGRPDGHFYQNATTLREEVKKVVVVSDDCPHLGASYKTRLKDLYGENHHLYKSMVNAEFSSTEEQVVLPFEKYERCVKFECEHYPDKGGDSAGLDLSGGGDEQVLTIRNGNKVIAQYAWRIKDATVLVEELCRKFEFHNLRGRPINSDGGGMGITIINMLWKAGWKNVRAIYNNSDPQNSLAYYNTGAEMWFNLATLIENIEILFSPEIRKDPILKKQLCNRYYKLVNSGNTTVSQLESKPQAKSKGHPSPDRADSLALCFLNYKTPQQSKEKKARLKTIEESIKTLGVVRTVRGFIKSSSGNGSWDSYIRKSGIVNATSKRTNSANSELRKELHQNLELIKNNLL